MPVTTLDGRDFGASRILRLPLVETLPLSSTILISHRRPPDGPQWHKLSENSDLTWPSVDHQCSQVIKHAMIDRACALKKLQHSDPDGRPRSLNDAANSKGSCLFQTEIRVSEGRCVRHLLVFREDFQEMILWRSIVVFALCIRAVDDLRSNTVLYHKSHDNILHQ